MLYQDPSFFMREMLNMPVTEQQQEMGDAIKAGNRKNAWRSGHGIGKTAYIAGLGIWFLSTRKSCRVIYTAVKEDQLRHQVWSEMNIWLSKGNPILRNWLDVQATKVCRKENPEDAFALARVAPKGSPEGQAGWHHDHLLIIVDEASGVEDQFIEALEGGLTKDDNILILSGNPTRRSGQFFRCFHSERSKWRTLHFSSLDSPLVSDDYPADIASRYGKESNVFRVRVLGEFPHSDDDSLILLEYIEAAAKRAADAQVDPIVIGVDPGRSVDGDATGLIARSGNRVLAARQVWVKDLVQVQGHAKRFRDEVIEARPELDFGWFAVDVIGLGAGVYDGLVSTGEKCSDVNVSLPPAKRYRSPGEPKPGTLRDELWLAAKDFIHGEGSTRGLLDTEELEILNSELSSPRYGLDSQGRIKVESKESMKRRGLKSPNLADALCLTFAPEPGAKSWVVLI
jgi:hypothetical protein